MSYRILKEFTDEDKPAMISQSPFWIIAVIRFAQPLTFSRKKLFAHEKDASYDAGVDDLIRERSLIALSDDVLQLQIQSSKATHISSLQATLANGSLNYLQEIQPNDWVFSWILNSETAGRELLKRVLVGEACNKFDDGLKFVGRVQSIRKKTTQAPTGQRTIRYTLSAAGFKEMESTAFYDPALVKQEESLGQTLTEMGIELDEVFADAGKNAGGLTTTKIIPRLLKLLLGEGIPPESSQAGPDVQIASGLTQTKEAPFAYAIPQTACDLLGQTNQSKQVPSYADILELVIGLQKYGTQSGSPEKVFSPDGAAGQSSNFRTLNDKLLGSFQPLPITFTTKTVWSILEEFKNQAVNEIYATLRVNPAGNVLPTVVVRQLPFSTSYAMEQNGEDLTGFLELPRWYADPILVNDIDIGKSDALHINFVHTYGQASAEAGVSLTEQIIQNPPIRDEEDIKRSGLRAHMQTVNCSIDDTQDEAGKWMLITADFMIGQQFTLTGTCDMIGISAPICPGDNFEIDDTVYHIEAVSHVCSINGGLKQFNTSLSLSHGMRSDTPKNAASQSKQDTNQISGVSEIVGVNKELLIYSGMKEADNTGFDPGQTIATRTEKQSNAPTTAGDNLFGWENGSPT